MSSPSNNLSKNKRSPLPGHPRPRVQVPYRQAVTDELESPLPEPSSLDDHTHLTLDEHIHRSIIDGLKGHHKSMKGRGMVVSPGSDAELLVSMAQRLKAVERELLTTKREVIEKNEYIGILESKIAMLEASQNWDQTGQAELMRQHCQALQNQVDEMEEFLNDYGMVWVGRSGAVSHDSHVTSEGCSAGNMWSPNSSLVTEQEGGVDFDAIVRNVRQLNILAGEGSSEVTRTPKGAKLKVLDPVPLTLYNNGLSMFAGPFRPYSDPSTQQVIRDLTDGYFPSELQSNYPDGVPLQISDQRDVHFKQKPVLGDFPGSGHQLGGDKGPSRLLPAGSQLRTSPKPRALKETSQLVGQRQVSLDQFLSRLPKSVVKGGRVLDIRAGIRDTLSQDKHDGVPKLNLVETGVLKEMRSRLELAEDERPPTPTHLATLSVKTEDGEQTYVLKMKSSETIKDVRNYIDKLRHSEGQSCDYLLKTTFPPVTLDDPSATIKQCKLVPTATLYMAKRPR